MTTPAADGDMPVVSVVFAHANFGRAVFAVSLFIRRRVVEYLVLCSAAPKSVSQPEQRASEEEMTAAFFLG